MLSSSPLTRGRINNTDQVVTHHAPRENACSIAHNNCRTRARNKTYIFVVHHWGTSRNLGCAPRLAVSASLSPQPPPPPRGAHLLPLPRPLPLPLPPPRPIPPPPPPPPPAAAVRGTCPGAWSSTRSASRLRPSGSIHDRTVDPRMERVEYDTGFLPRLLRLQRIGFAERE